MNLFAKYQSVKQAVELAADEATSCHKLLEAILNQVVYESMRRYQQKISVGVEDSASDLLNTFKQKLAESIFETANQWRQVTQDYKPLLYPRGCRFCHARGNDTILVIEQDPQMRTLLFDRGMLGEGFTSVGGEERVRLSLPYSVFLLHFRNTTFLGLYCGWRTRPLGSLDDTLSKPLLPNIHDNLNVCMAGHSSGTIVAQTEDILTRFWNSRFSNDLSVQWWAKWRIDPRLATAKLWQENSERDQLFVLGLRYPGERTLQHILDVLTTGSESPDESSFRHHLSEEIDKCVANLFSKISAYFQRTKFERHYPKDIKDSLKNAIELAIKDLSSIIFALNVEVRDLAKYAKAEPMAHRPQSSYWRDYDGDVS